MRQKRAKAYRKLMALYSISFGFRQPYQILVDSEMCKSAVDLKIEVVKQLSAVLQGEIKPMITQCCIHELYLQGKLLQPTVDLAKTFERRKCNHRQPIAGDDCLADVVGDANKHRYVIATQSQPLRVKLRNIPAVPIIHLNRSVMILEPPSDATIRAKESTEEDALHLTAPDVALVGPSTSAEPPRKKKRIKGPNPLSVKKKKVTGVSESKAKGHGKRKENELESSTSKVEVMTGGKRKRGDDEDPENGQDVQTHSGRKESATKRKRRRKAVVADSVDVSEH